MKLLFTKEETAIVGYSEIDVELDNFEFNQKIIPLAHKESQYMGEDDDSPNAAMAYTINLQGVNAITRTGK